MNPSERRERLQQEPVEDMQEITDDARLEGLLAQVRADATGASPEQVEGLLRDRMANTGVELSDEDVAGHVKDIAAH